MVGIVVAQEILENYVKSARKALIIITVCKRSAAYGKCCDLILARKAILLVCFHNFATAAFCRLWPMMGQDN